ncbi:MAG: glycoside hydrolase family 43 protein [Acidobacteria bacterium]|nr:glycoside hydrolase family 43 protein [Acidobacteriota bacterium]
MKIFAKIIGGKTSAILTLILAVSIFAAGQSKHSKTAGRTFTNPLVTSQDSADPWMFYHQGFYYFTATLDPQGGVWLWRSRFLSGLETGEKKKIYDAPKDGLRSKQIWAPELHRLGKRWYLYFTASDGTDENHRIHVLESRSDNPWSEYDYKARVFDVRHDGWAIDATVFRDKNDSLYMAWCGHVPGNGNGIYIAPMSNPWTISGKRVLISQADFDWERVRYPINEAPEILRRGDNIFLVYSASDTGTPDYALGMLVNSGGDVMNPASWKKSPRAVFAQYRSADGNVFGPGHNGFFKSPDEREDWLIYHGKESSKYTYGGRRARAQKFGWNSDGTPDFGRPIPAGIAVPSPSGEKRKR